jgi:hypothetical protein
MAFGAVRHPCKDTSFRIIGKAFFEVFLIDHDSTSQWISQLEEESACPVRESRRSR